MVMKEARRGAVSPGVFLVDSSVSRRIPTLRLKNRRTFTLFTTQGTYEQAEPLLKRALAIYKKTCGPHHPDTKAIQENYARFLQEKQRKRREQDEPSEGSQQKELALAPLARHLMLLPIYGAIHNSNVLLGMNQNAPGGQTRSGRPTSSQHA
jgi:hypothetical protein